MFLSALFLSKALSKLHLKNFVIKKLRFRDGAVWTVLPNPGGGGGGGVNRRDESAGRFQISPV